MQSTYPTLHHLGFKVICVFGMLKTFDYMRAMYRAQLQTLHTQNDMLQTLQTLQTLQQHRNKN